MRSTCQSSICLFVVLICVLAGCSGKKSQNSEPVGTPVNLDKLGNGRPFLIRVTTHSSIASILDKKPVNATTGMSRHEFLLTPGGKSLTIHLRKVQSETKAGGKLFRFLADPGGFETLKGPSARSLLKAESEEEFNTIVDQIFRNPYGKIELDAHGQEVSRKQIAAPEALPIFSDGLLVLPQYCLAPMPLTSASWVRKVPFAMVNDVEVLAKIKYTMSDDDFDGKDPDKEVRVKVEGKFSMDGKYWLDDRNLADHKAGRKNSRRAIIRDSFVTLSGEMYYSFRTGYFVRGRIQAEDEHRVATVKDGQRTTSKVALKVAWQFESALPSTFAGNPKKNIRQGNSKRDSRAERAPPKHVSDDEQLEASKQKNPQRMGDVTMIQRKDLPKPKDLAKDLERETGNRKVGPAKLKSDWSKIIFQSSSLKFVSIRMKPKPAGTYLATPVKKDFAKFVLSGWPVPDRTIQGRRNRRAHRC